MVIGSEHHTLRVRLAAVEGQWQRRRDCPHTLDRNAPITLLQLDPSAQAPRASTTLPPLSDIPCSGSRTGRTLPE